MRTDERIARLEAACGFSLPAEYRSFIATHSEDAARPGCVVATNPDYWGVSNIFEIGDGADYLQADEAYRAVGDVIPTGTVPIAEDSSGNLYLLDCRPASTFGAVYWWDHEQEPGEDRIEKVADTFSDFLGSLAPAPED